MLELKRCPFCGSQAEMKISYGNGRDMPELYIKCNSCGAKMHETSIYDDMKSMSEAWNRRAYYVPEP